MPNFARRDPLNLKQLRSQVLAARYTTFNADPAILIRLIDELQDARRRLAELEDGREALSQAVR